MNVRDSRHDCVKTEKVSLLIIVIAVLMTRVARAQPVEPPVVKWPTPRVAVVVHDEAIFRVGPTEDHDRRTPLQKGAVLLIRGQAGKWLLADLGGDDKGWVEEKDISWSAVPPTQNTLRNILVRPNGDHTRIDIQMTQRTSFDVIETSDPPALVVRLHRTTAMINELAQYAGDPLLRPGVSRQVAPGVVELRLPLASRGLWGWSAAYGVSPNMPTDPAGHDFARSTVENLRITLAWPPRRTTRLSGVTVVLDGGHGGPDSGAVGVGGLKEKDINLACAQAAQKALEKRGARVVMTRDSDRAVAADDDSELQARVDVAHAARGNVFVSIHHNARANVDDSRAAYGVFVYYYQPWSADLARNLMDPIADAQQQRVRAYVFRSFAVMRQPYMPSVLIEVGFISNPEEERKMRAPDYPARIGEAVADGVERFINERLGRP